MSLFDGVRLCPMGMFLELKSFEGRAVPCLIFAAITTHDTNSQPKAFRSIPFVDRLPLLCRNERGLRGRRV